MDAPVFFSATVEASAIRALSGDEGAVHALGDQVCMLRWEGLSHDGITLADRCVCHAGDWVMCCLLNLSLGHLMFMLALIHAFMQATGVG